MARISTVAIELRDYGMENAALAMDECRVGDFNATIHRETVHVFRQASVDGVLTDEEIHEIGQHLHFLGRGLEKARELDGKDDSLAVLINQGIECCTKGKAAD